MLVAFNAAPGTVAPEGAPPYGAYAQALAEMIRAGGLSLPEVFDRVRLRVNDMTKSAQLPWDAQKIDTSFVFFERQAEFVRRRSRSMPACATSRSAISMPGMPTPRRSSATRYNETTASPVAMAGMIKSSIHHFDSFDGLAGNGGGSGKDGEGAAICCGASLVGTGIDTVETTFGIVSTISVGCSGGTGGAGGELSPGSGWHHFE